MKYPERVEMGCYTIKIRVKEYTDNCEQLGIFDPVTQTVTFWRTGRKDLDFHTYVHEMLHAALWVLYDCPHWDDEDFVDPLSNYLGGALKLVK